VKRSVSAKTITTSKMLGQSSRLRGPWPAKTKTEAASYIMTMPPKTRQPYSVIHFRYFRSLGSFSFRESDIARRKFTRLVVWSTRAKPRKPAKTHQATRAGRTQGRSSEPPEKYQAKSAARKAASKAMPKPTAEMKPAAWTLWCCMCHCSSISERCFTSFQGVPDLVSPYSYLSREMIGVKSTIKKPTGMSTERMAFAK